MVTVGAVYSIEPQVRTPESVMGVEGQKKEEAPNARARHKRVWASVERTPEEAFQEARRRDPEGKRPWVMLVDGHEGQLKDFHAAIERHGVEVTLILDFIHVLEYLWKAAWCFFAPGCQEAEAWVGERALQILRGKASDVAAGMRRSATLLRDLGPEERKGVDTCADYLVKYREMLRYDRYLAEGFPIATGVIEGACRHLVKDRMDITGARWRLRSAEAVLNPVAPLQRRYQAYWAFHKAQEHMRNHLSRMASHDFRKAA